MIKTQNDRSKKFCVILRMFVKSEKSKCGTQTKSKHFRDASTNPQSGEVSQVQVSGEQAAGDEQGLRAGDHHHLPLQDKIWLWSGWSKIFS